jgi:hypothetical protein
MDKPLKPTAAQMFNLRAKAGDLGFRVKLNDLPPVEWKEWKPDEATLKAWERAANPYRRFVGDGR